MDYQLLNIEFYLRNSLIILFLFNTLNLKSQVPIKPDVAFVKSEVRQYDSLSNFLGIEIDKYLGQKVTVLPLHPLEQPSGYDNFVKNPNKPVYASSNAYLKKGSRANKGMSKTPYSDLVNRTFIIKNIIKIGSKDFLELEDLDNKETIYFNYDYRNPHKFPFIVEGYYKKKRQLNLGREFYARTTKINHYSIYTQETTDINEKKFEADIGSKWSVVDVIATNTASDSKIVFLCEGMNRKIYISENLIKEYDLGEKNKFEPIKTLYSEEIFMKILNHQFDIGMDTYLVGLACGTPNRITKSTYSNGTNELWSYDSGRYLYFRDGKLVKYE